MAQYLVRTREYPGNWVLADALFLKIRPDGHLTYKGHVVVEMHIQA